MEEMNTDKQKNLYKSPFSIRLLKRKFENSTHQNLVDDNIHEIIPLRIDNVKYRITICLYILTVGMLWGLTKLFPKMYLYLNCVECGINQADLFVVIDKENGFNLVHAYHENFFRRSSLLYYLYSFNTKNKTIKESMENSPYVGDDYMNKKEKALVLYYRHNKYIYNEINKEFEPARMDYSIFTNTEIHTIFGEGLSSALDFNYLLNKFGKNILELESQSFFRILFFQMIHPFYLYQIYSIIIWIKADYIPFCIIVVISSLGILIVNSFQNYKNYQRILNFSHSSACKILRRLQDEQENYDINHKLEMLNNESQFIVPGDIIELTNKEIIPCDCILLDGYCTVNEADLTGESSLVMKSPLPSNHLRFDYQANSKSILFNGTKMDKCESLQHDGKVRALVINTGFNTQRGDLIQNILFPKPTNFKIFKDIISYIISVSILYIVAVILYANFSFKNSSNKTNTDIAIECLDLLTVILPPTLPICMTFSSYYFHYSLNQKKISCINDSRMNAAGRVNIIVLDKTGTLTEEGLYLHGFQTTKLKTFYKFKTEDADESAISNNKLQEYLKNKTNSPQFDEVETTAKTYNYIHREFWRQLCYEGIHLVNANTNTRELDKSFNENYTSNEDDDIKILDADEERKQKKNTLIEIEENFSINETYNRDKQSTQKLKNNNSNFLNYPSKLEHKNLLFSKNYKTDMKNNIIYFVECLATCHSIDKLNGNYFGNNIDKKIFDSLGWLQVKYNEEKNKKENNEINNVVKYEMIPKKSYKINENYVFKNLGKIPHPKLKNYKLAIIKRFEFSSKFQSMSVIIYNHFDDSYRFFIKGSPEKIFEISTPNTIPENFHQKLMEHTQNGLRVLACATKLLPYRNNFYENEQDRYKYECDLTFLGFIIFKNKLKRDSKLVISKLNESHCKLVMATGDNPFTSISVARECEFIVRESRVFLIDLQKTRTNKKEKLKFTLVSKSFISSAEPAVIPQGEINKDLAEINKDMSDMLNSKTERKFLHQDNSNTLYYNNPQINKNSTIPNIQTFLELFSEKIDQSILKYSTICISGKAFLSLLGQIREFEKERKNARKSKIDYPKDEEEEFLEYSSLLKLIEKYGKIFFRMSPTDKVELVNFFKLNKSNIVAMVGDGANDCGALLCADTGISINHREGTNITSHFYCTEESISCVEIIIKNGRACFENSIIIFKYMFLYAIIQLSSVLLLYYNNTRLSDNQYFFIDFFIVMFKSILISKTGANLKIMKDKPNSSIINLKFLLSVLGQSAIQILTMWIYYFTYLNVYVSQPVEHKEVSLHNSYIFILTVSQYSVVIFSFNQFAKHKKGIFSNKTYVIFTSWVMFFILSLLTINYFNQFGQNWELVYMVRI